MVHVVGFDLFRLFTFWTNPTGPIGPSKLAPVHLHSPSWSHLRCARTRRTDQEEYYCEIHATTRLVAIWMLNWQLIKLETIKSINQNSMPLNWLHWGWRRDKTVGIKLVSKSQSTKMLVAKGGKCSNYSFSFHFEMMTVNFIFKKRKNTTKNTSKTCKDTAFDPFPPQNWTKEPPNSFMTIGQKIIFQPLEQTLDGSNYS